MNEKGEPKLILNPDAEVPFEYHPFDLTTWEKNHLEPISKELHSVHKDYIPHDHLYEYIETPYENLTITKESPITISSNHTVSDFSIMSKKNYGKSTIGLTAAVARALENIQANEQNADNVEKRREVDPAVREWISKHVTIGKFASAPAFTDIDVEPGDEFVQEHQEDIIRALKEDGIVPYYWKKQKHLDELLAYTSGLGEMSNDFAHELISDGIVGLILQRPELFPELKYDGALLREILAESSLRELQDEYHIFDKFEVEDWQNIADEMMADGRHYNLLSLLDTDGESARFELSLEQVIKAVQLCPNETLNYLEVAGGARLKSRYTSIDIINAFIEIDREVKAYDVGLGENLTESDIYDIASISKTRANNLLRFAPQIKVLQSEEFLRKFFEDFDDVEFASMKYSTYSEQFQSHIFELKKAMFVDTTHLDNVLCINYGFTHLSDDCYNYLIDNCRASIQRLGPMEKAIRTFTFMGASVATIERLKTEYGEYFAQLQARRKETASINDARTERRDAEESYLKRESITLQLADPEGLLTPELITEHFEYDHVVRRAPRLQDQLTDDTRTNEIRCRKNYDVGTYTMSEIDMLRQFDGQAKKAITELEQVAGYVDNLKSLHNNLTFIGDKEYQEAVVAIASYWKHLLDTDPELQILVYTGVSAEKELVKSDQYMFDKILAHFSDDELEKYGGRLVQDELLVRNADPQHLKVVLLDDWTISGSQLRSAASNYLYKYQRFEKCVEVQLIAASKERIALGLEGVHFMKYGIDNKDIPVPVRAYYLAHDAPLVQETDAKGVHITGAHSSVDYGFENVITSYKASLGKSEVPLTKIVRAYREDGFTMSNIERLARVSSDSDDQKQVA